MKKTITFLKEKLLSLVSKILKRRKRSILYFATLRTSSPFSINKLSKEQLNFYKRTQGMKSMF
jgi:hypothetical protein